MLKRFALMLVFQECWVQACFVNVVVTTSVSHILGKWALSRCLIGFHTNGFANGLQPTRVLIVAFFLLSVPCVVF